MAHDPLKFLPVILHFFGGNPVLAPELLLGHLVGGPHLLDPPLYLLLDLIASLLGGEDLGEALVRVVIFL